MTPNVIGSQDQTLQPRQRGGETHAHAWLKHAAARWLADQGICAVATEVRCPIARFRLDVAGVYCGGRSEEAPQAGDAICTVPRLRPSERPQHPEWSVIIECKASRADFLRNSTRIDELIARRDQLESDRRSMENQVLKASDPHAVRLQSALFADLDEWDFTHCRNRSYRDILGQLRLVHRELYGKTKFHRVSRYALADFLLIAAPAGVIRSQDLPEGWGLLEFEIPSQPKYIATRDPGRSDDSPVRLRNGDGGLRRSPPRTRETLLRNIAVAACRHAPWRRAVEPTCSAGPELSGLCCEPRDGSADTMVGP